MDEGSTATEHEKLTDRQFRAGLSAQQRADLQRTADLPGLVRLVQHWTLIALLAAAIGLGVTGWPLLLPVLGTLLVFQFTLMHEATHRTAFKSGWLNTLASWLPGLLLFLPPLWFRLFHFAHHRHTQDPEHDPELVGGGKPETWPEYVRHVSGLPLWRSALTTLWSNALGRNRDDFVPPSRRADVAREARIMLTLYAGALVMSLVLGSSLLIWIWLLPILIGQPLLRLYLLAEHGRCAFVANMLENSRTTYTNRFLRWLAWNMPYHAEHHTLPTVPFHRLPDLNAMTRSHLGATSAGYRAFTAEFQADLDPH